VVGLVKTVVEIEVETVVEIEVEEKVV